MTVLGCAALIFAFGVVMLVLWFKRAWEGSSRERHE